MRVTAVFLLTVVVGCSATTSVPSVSTSNAITNSRAAAAAAAPYTAFVSAGNEIYFAAAPYNKWSQTVTIRTGVGTTVTPNGDLFFLEGGYESGDKEATGYIRPPYTGQPHVLNGSINGSAIASDSNGNVYASGGYSRQYGVLVFLNPTYKTKFLAAPPNSLIPSMAELGSVVAISLEGSAVHESAGQVDILGVVRGNIAENSVTGITYPGPIAANGTTLVVTQCPACVDASGKTFIAVVKYPYSKVDRVVARIPSKQLFSVAIDAAGDVFANENAKLVFYRKGKLPAKLLSNAGRAVEMLAIGKDSTLLFSHQNGDGIYELAAPYTGRPKQILSTSGDVESIYVTP